MARGGAASRRQRGVLLWSLLATPACGLVVGFEPRECEDCTDSDSTSLGDGTGGGGSASDAGGMSNASGVDSNGSGGTTATSLAPDNTSSTSSDSGGAGETNTDLGDTTSGTGGEGGNGGTGDGGSDTLSGSSEGSNAGGASSSGGASTASDTTSNTGGSTGGDAGMGGTGGDGTGASGGDTLSSTTSVGGSGNAGNGSGGTGGSPACEVKRTFDASGSEGVYPSAIMLSRDSSTRPWDVTWVENDKVYVSAHATNGSTVLAPTVLDDSGSHSTSVIATQGAYAFVAYGEFASGDASIGVNRSTPVGFEGMLEGDTGALGGATAPQVVGIAMQGNSTDALVAAIGADGMGILALFQDTVYVSSDAELGTVAALAPFDLDGRFGLAYIQDGGLQLSLAEPDLSGVEPLEGVPDAEPIASAPDSLGAAPMAGGAALVWEQENGVYLTTVDTDGEAEAPVRVSFGPNDVLPRVDVVGTQLYVSWIDADAQELYMRRFPTGLSGSPEDALKISESVAETSYGLATDPFSATKTLALSYATERLKVTIVTCPSVPSP